MTMHRYWWEDVAEANRPCETKAKMIEAKRAVDGNRIDEIAKCLRIAKNHLPDMSIVSIIYYVGGLYSGQFNGKSDADVLVALRRYIKTKGLS